MANENPQKIEKPQAEQTASQKDVGVRIFTMPERYRHGAHGHMHQPEKQVEKKPQVEVKAPQVPQAPKAPPKAPPTQKKKVKTSFTKKLLIIGGVVIIVLGVGGYILIQSVEPETTDTEPSTRPAPTVEVEEEEEELVEEEVEEEEPETEEEPDVFETEVVPGVDTDSDGLTDVEEEQVYSTNPKLPDTDSDGFLDGNEVFHRYNPGGTAPGTLLESGLVEAFTDSLNGVSYSFYLPSVWEISETEDGFVLEVATGEGFLINFEEKQEVENLEDWVSENTSLENGIVGSTKNGLDLVQAENQLTAYIDLGVAVMVFEYDTGIKARIDYLQTFQMILNSVVVEEEVSDVDEL